MKNEEKDLKIYEGRVLIARFMGISVAEYQHYALGAVIAVVPDDGCLDWPSLTIYSPDTSWDCLMSVVEKIKHIDILVFNYDPDKMARFREMRNHFLNLTITTPIELVYIRAIEVISLYNETRVRSL